MREQLEMRFKVLFPHLNERQRRLVMAQEARLLGHGGVRAVAQVAGVSETTVRAGVFELEAGGTPLADGRARRSGGGRKAVEQADPQVLSALMALVEPDERGDPTSPLRWTTKSLRNLAEELTRAGHVVSAPTVGRLLREAGFSLQSYRKTLEGKQHPDRDAQFCYINEQAKAHQADGQPVISVDTKKREQLGRLPNAGRQWRPKGEPVAVEDHSFFFTGPNVPHAIPYGIYDLARDSGWVSVGVDHDTCAFAVSTIRRWWAARGRLDYPDADRLLITADGGGSNSYRYRVWKAELADFAAETGLAVTVCHFPTGTSKWNKIEHRLFSHITMNWRGRPLTSHDVVVNSIAATTTRTGLTVHAELDPGVYPLGVSVSDEQMAALPIAAHEQRGQWNYTIHPSATITCTGLDRRTADRAATLHKLADPRLTGMTRLELEQLASKLAAAQDAAAEQRNFELRGRPRLHAKGAHGKPLLTSADKVLITVVYLRQICTQRLISDMIGVNPTSVGEAIAETTRLLNERRITISPTVLRFRNAAALHTFLEDAAEPVRPNLLQILGDPVLTGMTRDDLANTIARLSVRQSAEKQRRNHERRGGDRQPGARGGIFVEKITDAERVLAVILGERKVCTWETVAQLFGVSRRSIGNAQQRVRPLLEEYGLDLTRASVRYRSADAVLQAVAQHNDTTSTPKSTL